MGIYIGTPFQSAQMTLGAKKKIKGTQSLVVALLHIISLLGPQGNEWEEDVFPIHVPWLRSRSHFPGTLGKRSSQSVALWASLVPNLEWDTSLFSCNTLCRPLSYYSNCSLICWSPKRPYIPQGRDCILASLYNLLNQISNSENDQNQAGCWALQGIRE